jgi:hypothetical protein
MKESEAKLLAEHDALKEVAVELSETGARSTSDENGWLVRINGAPLASARRPVRIFASLDTVQETLLSLGIREFTVKGINNAAGQGSAQ